MTINKYVGKTREEAIEKAKSDLGPQVVIMNIKEIRPGGLFGVFKKSSYEVTGAIEDDVNDRPSYSQSDNSQDTPHSTFSAVADEKITIPPAGNDDIFGAAPAESAISRLSNNKSVKSAGKNGYTSAAPADTSNKSANSRSDTTGTPVKEWNMPTSGTSSSGSESVGGIDPDELKSAFKEVGDLIENTEKVPVSSISNYDSDKSVIHASQIKKGGNVIDFKSRKKEYNEEESESDAIYFSSTSTADNIGFSRILYNTLVDHEVDERYVNEILSDISRLINRGASVDSLISNVYQKMVLKVGSPVVISSGKKPKLVFLIGPTGVGKTTTIAKIASHFKLEQNKKLALFTADTYRIAATEQLSTYAKILGIPLEVVISPEELPEMTAKYNDCDLILVDTIGFSHKNEEQREALKKLLDSLPEKYEREVYLVLSATTKYSDLKDIVDSYRQFTKFALIFTKLDETEHYGSLLNIRMYSGAPLSYITNGQNVPNDIAVLEPQKLVKNLLGGE